MPLERSPIRFAFDITESEERHSFDVRVRISNPYYYIRFREQTPAEAVGLGFVALPDLSSRENVSIQPIDYYPLENRPGVYGEEIYQAASFNTNLGKFRITEIFKRNPSGLDTPLYYQHDIPITTDLYVQTGSDVIVLDKNFDPVDPDTYLVWTGGTETVTVFHNYEASFDPVSGDYEAYYVSYPLWDSTTQNQREYVVLLNPEPRFREAIDDDYDEFLDLPEDVPLYTVQEDGGDFLVTITYDIVNESPMNDLYGSASLIYAYRPSQLNEIGPLYPASLYQEDPWFPILTNGSFYTNGSRFYIEEYSQQTFIPYEPYKRQILEEAVILENKLLMTQHGNLHVDPTDGFHLDIAILRSDGNPKWAISTNTELDYYVDEFGDETDIPYDHTGIVSYNERDGLIQISYTLLDPSDIVQVSYYYIEYDFEYNQVNLNPIYDDDMIGRTVVLFIQPYNEGDAVPDTTVFHLLLDEENKIVDTNALAGYSVVPYGANVSKGTIIMNRDYTGDADVTWEVEIVTANSVYGDVTDAEFKYRQGTGAWSSPITVTGDWQELDYDVEIKFVPADAGQDFVVGDTWDINVEANLTGLDENVIGMHYDTFVELYCLPEPDATSTTTTTTTTT
jgi:hypothetical protein